VAVLLCSCLNSESKVFIFNFKLFYINSYIIFSSLYSSKMRNGVDKTNILNFYYFILAQYISSVNRIFCEVAEIFRFTLRIYFKIVIYSAKTNISS